MELFSKNYVDSLPPFKKFISPRVVSLTKNNLAPVRRLCAHTEYWFQNLEAAEQPDMAARLRSTDDRQHISAFCELVLLGLIVLALILVFPAGKLASRIHVRLLSLAIACVKDES